MPDNALRWAEVIDAYRIWPRALITLYGLVAAQVTWWFMTLPDPNMAQAALVSTVWGASAGWFGLYVNTGRKWGKA